jgi:hypothetical protein
MWALIGAGQVMGFVYGDFSGMGKMFLAIIVMAFVASCLGKE